MKSIRVAMTVVLAALVASSALAQTRGNARLNGKVVDEQGQPIADVVVKAQMAGQTEILQGKSDKKGEWRVNGMADGQWQVELTKDGLDPMRVPVEVRNERATPLNVTMLKPAPRVDPNIEINAQVQKAAQLAQDGKFADARKIYEDLLAKYPSIYQLEGFIARTYAAEAQPAKAMEHLKIAMEKEPNDVDLKLLQADLLIESGDKAGARAILDAVDMTKVKDPFPFMNAAITLINEKKGAEAIAMLTKLQAQFPNQHEIYYYRGRAYLSEQKLDEAKAELEKFVSVAPTAKDVPEAKKILEQLTKK
jgi:tetratricopeptide (TPR) repeat protein